MAKGSGGTSRTEDSSHRCVLFGVLNVTPDSFSDGGQFVDVSSAIRHAEQLRAEGADVIDVGGESTRPRGATYGEGATPVSAEEEIARVIPVVEGLVARDLSVSVDTRKHQVARQALQAGAQFVNDVSARADDNMLKVVSSFDATLIRMHSRGNGEVRPPNTDYADSTARGQTDGVVGAVLQELRAEVARAEAAGVPSSKIWIDPGLGFAKTADQSLALLRQLPALVATGHPVLVGASRKSFLAKLAANPDGSGPEPSSRIGASVSAALWASRCGARGLRVHDVAATRQALMVSKVLFPPAPPPAVESDAEVRA